MKYLKTLERFEVTGSLDDYFASKTAEEIVMDIFDWLGDDKLTSDLSNNFMPNDKNAIIVRFWADKKDGHFEIKYAPEGSRVKGTTFSSDRIFVNVTKDVSGKNTKLYKSDNPLFTKVKRVYDYLFNIYYYQPTKENAINRIKYSMKLIDNSGEEHFEYLYSYIKKHFIAPLSIYNDSSQYTYFYNTYITGIEKFLDSDVPAENKMSYIEWLKNVDKWTPELEEEYGHYTRGKKTGLWSFKEFTQK